MKKFVFLILLLLVFISKIVYSQSYSSLEVKELKLSNGLTVWLNEDHSQPKVVGALVVKAGSKDCPNTGIAHYFEHIMFKGTDKIGSLNYTAEKIILDSIVLKYDELAATKDDIKRTKIQQEINGMSIRSSKYVIPNEFDRLISRYGGSGLNAATSDDYTVYYNEFSPQYIKQWAEINSERVLNPVFRLFQSELETVYEEKNMYNDRIGGQAFEKVMERFFAPHPYAFPIIGSTENLKNPKLSDMKKFYDDFYVAGNMGLIISGDFNINEVIPVLEKSFSRIRSGQAPKNKSIAPQLFKGKETFVVKIPVPVIKILALGWRGVPANHKDEVKLRILSGLLNNANSTGYLDKLTVDGKVMQAAAMSESLNEAGFLGVLVIPKLLFQTYGKAKSLAMHEIERVKNGDFTEEVFTSLKLEQKRNYEKDLENIDSRSQKMMSLFSEGKSWSEYLNEVKEIDAITKAEIVETANKYFTENYLEITKKTGNYPNNKLTKPNFAPIIPINSEAKSEYAINLEKMKSNDAHPRFLNFDTDAQTVQLSPKATLYVTKNTVNNIFTLNFEFGKGTLESKLIKPMNTYIQLLGTDSLTFGQFKTKLQTIGSVLSFSAEQDKFVIHILGFDSHFEQTISLVANFMKNIKADSKKLAQVIDEKKVNNKSINKSSDELAMALLGKVQHGTQSDYLYNLSLSETKKLTGEELIAAFHDIIKVECNMHYCGNLSTEIVAAQIKKYIDINAIDTASKSPIYRELLTDEKPVVYFIDMPKSSQSIISAYVAGGVNPDLTSRFTASIFNNYFGGSMSSLVFQQIREFRSLAYRANANYWLSDYKHKDKNGQFVAMLSTQCDKTTDAIDVLDSLIKQMPAKAERVETSRQDVVNDANNQYPSLRNRSSQIAALKKNGFLSDPNKGLIESVANMNINNIIDFYNQNIKGRTITYIVVGNSKTINMNKLARFGNIVKVKAEDVYK